MVNSIRILSCSAWLQEGFWGLCLRPGRLTSRRLMYVFRFKMHSDRCSAALHLSELHCIYQNFYVQFSELHWNFFDRCSALDSHYVAPCRNTNTNPIPNPILPNPKNNRNLCGKRRHRNKVPLSVYNNGYFRRDGAGFLRGLYHEAETTDRSSSKLSKWDLRVKQGFGWGKFIKFYLYIEYLSQLNSFGLPNCTCQRTLGSVRRTAPMIIVLK